MILKWFFLFCRQVQSVLYIIILQALTKRVADSPQSTCGDAAFSWRGGSPSTILSAGCSSLYLKCWRFVRRAFPPLVSSVPLMVMAGLCSFFSCSFIILFHSRYRRLEAEEEATNRTKRFNSTATGGRPPSTWRLVTILLLGLFSFLVGFLWSPWWRVRRETVIPSKTLESFPFFKLKKFRKFLRNGVKTVLNLKNMTELWCTKTEVRL